MIPADIAKSLTAAQRDVLMSGRLGGVCKHTGTLGVLSKKRLLFWTTDWRRPTWTALGLAVRDELNRRRNRNDRNS